MRISIEGDDPGHANYVELCRRRNLTVRVTLDGVAQDLCLTADSDEGWIKRLNHTAPDRTEIVRGVVELSFFDIAGTPVDVAPSAKPKPPVDFFAINRMFSS